MSPEGAVNRVVMLSGGATSYLAAKRVKAAAKPVDQLWLVFADTGIEDEDLHRFLHDVSLKLDTRITRVADGRTPWDVFRDVRFLGNSRVDPCSRILKRELLRKWLDDTLCVENTIVSLGFDWDEAHRVQRGAKFWAPYTVDAPMAEPPYLSKAQMLSEVSADGIAIPRLYRMGFEHNNCGGFCVKSGQAQFAHLLKVMPERYRQHEAQEEAIRSYLGRDVAIMKDRRGERSRPLTMREFRERLEGSGEYDQLDFGACSCFAEPP